MSDVDRMGVKSRAILNSNTDPELTQNCESNYEDQYFDIDMLKLGWCKQQSQVIDGVMMVTSGVCNMDKDGYEKLIQEACRSQESCQEESEPGQA
ncbi:hypothetical protein RRG08_044988 [Elysia crispata]|uniref:Uncharacterized protein n=1 Tax=Elysia crispata TaxID=231223 RepID=A0AAE0Y417_9GAST|nr:hypothetical protein RRG08_044988 [Elysia crispata]